MGDKVKLVSNNTGSINRIGSVGIVTEDKLGDGLCFRVLVKGVSDDNIGNSSSVKDLKLILTKQEKIEKLLKKISKLNKE